MVYRLLILANLLFFLVLNPYIAHSEESKQSDSLTCRHLMFSDNLPKYMTATGTSMIPVMPKLVKDLLFDKYILEDNYTYGSVQRSFQWEKIAWALFDLDRLQNEPGAWGIIQNRLNSNGIAVLSKKYRRNEYDNIEDVYGVERYQGIPVYAINDTLTPERYGLDGSLVKLTQDKVSFYRTNVAGFPGEWLIPKKYVKPLDTIVFNKVVFVDRLNQNIATIERGDNKWIVRSMNPASTGVHHPPYKKETPLGIFVIQEKKPKMIYLRDGTSNVDGFSPWASRFCNGGYIHGVPVDLPRTDEIEYSWSLGTTPRSHMCVRNATSHAKFVYDWTNVFQTLIFVIE